MADYRFVGIRECATDVEVNKHPYESCSVRIQCIMAKGVPVCSNDVRHRPADARQEKAERYRHLAMLGQKSGKALDGFI